MLGLGFICPVRPTDVMQVYTICVALLTLLLLAMAFHTGTIRGFIEKRYHNPEDKPLGRGKTTHLLALHHAFPDAPYIHLDIGWRGQIPQGHPLFADQA